MKQSSNNYFALKNSLKRHELAFKNPHLLHLALTAFNPAAALRERMPIAPLLCLLGVLLLATDMQGQFSDATGQLNIPNATTAGGCGSGVTFFDFDQDGWDDLTMGTGIGPIVIRKNHSGTLLPASFSIPNSNNGYVHSLLWVDYDNDHDNDLLVCKRPGALELWQNNGEMEFENVAINAGLDGAAYDYSFAAFGDYNNDGCLDLYVAKNYVVELNDMSNASVLYRSNCDGTFTDATEEAGVFLSPRAMFQPIFADFNGDGWADLFLGIDRFTWPNELFINNQDGTFTRVSPQSGVADDQYCSMSSSVSDYDHDADLDIYVTNNPNQEGNYLYNNNGEGTFVNMGIDVGVETLLTCWSGLWIDYDNDSWEDLLVCVGPHPIPPTPNQFFVSENGVNFEESAAAVGLGSDPQHSQTCAKGDLNNNGYFDIAVNNQSPYISRLYKNAPGDANYLSVSLEGTLANFNGIGTWLHCYSGGEHYVRYTLCGENHGGQNSGKQIFGLGSETAIDSLVLEWNSGTREVYTGLAINQNHHLVEGMSFIEPLAIVVEGETLLCPGDSVLLDAGEFESYLWSNGHTERFLYVASAGNYSVTAWNEFGLPVTSPSVQVELTPVPEVNATTTPVSCAGFSDAAIALNLNTAPFDSLIWNTGDDSDTISNLSAGLYSFSGLDSNRCPVSGEIFIETPLPLFGSVSTSAVLCYGDSTGIAEVETLGGTPPIAIDWDGLNPNGLSAGDYIVLVTDTNGCLLPLNFSIDQPDSLWIELSVQNASNGNNNGAANLTVSGGTPPYAIDWSSGASDTLWISGLAPGQYTVGVTDDNGCNQNAGFLVETNTGVGRQQSTGIKIFPNPANEVVYIASDRGSIGMVELFNTTGLRLFNEVHWGNRIELNTSGLAPGIYLVRFPSIEGSPKMRLLISR